MSDQTPQESSETQSQPRIAPLNKMAFAQLVNSMRQSGLMLNADAIAAVRDNEFRVKNYQKAFDVIEGQYMRLGAEASRRQSELMRQEMQYKSGALKMTPKQWMDRQRRETEKTQKIELARRQFTRILDGLAVMRFDAANDSEAENREDAD